MTYGVLFAGVSHMISDVSVGVVRTADDNLRGRYVLIACYRDRGVSECEHGGGHWTEPVEVSREYGC